MKKNNKYALLLLVLIAVIASLYSTALNGEYHTRTFPLGDQKMSGEAGEVVSCEYVSFWREPSIFYYWEGQTYNTDEFSLTGLSAECQENKTEVNQKFNDNDSKISFRCYVDSNASGSGVHVLQYLLGDTDVDSNASGSGVHEIYCIKGVIYGNKVFWYGEKVVGYDEILCREKCTLVRDNNTVKAFVEYYPPTSFEDLMQTLFFS